MIYIEVNPPEYAKSQENVSIIFDADRNPIKFNYLHNSVGEKTVFTSFLINEEGKPKHENVLFPETLTKGTVKKPMKTESVTTEKFSYKFESDISEDITNIPMEMMPGFNFSWMYEPLNESQAYFRTTWPYNVEFRK